MMKQIRTIFLIGFSGSGKSTIGPLLARKLRAEFYDTDDMIEHFAGRPILEIFADQGEPAFRAMEADVIRQLAGNSEHRRVIALGGGAFESRENRDLASACGCTIYLQTAVPIIIKRLGNDQTRPLLQIKPHKGETIAQALRRRITGLLEKRKPNYRRAHITVSTSRMEPSEIVRQIISRLERYRGTN